MAKIRDFLLWVPIMLVATGIVLTLATFSGFVFEASVRGFHEGMDGSGCFINSADNSKPFCPNDYGFLGMKQWMDQKDLNAFYSIFEKNQGIDVPENVCKERVISYDVVKTNDSTTIHVKCNS